MNEANGRWYEDCLLSIIENIRVVWCSIHLVMANLPVIATFALEGDKFKVQTCIRIISIDQILYNNIHRLITRPTGIHFQ